MITIRDGIFCDPQGRQVLLHGINLVNKNPEVGYLGMENRDTLAAFRSWGCNCIRLGVIWDGLEPQPGIYNEAYLQGIDQQIAWARENDLFVFLDMHQDLYSVLFSDGAPAWATLTEGLPHQIDGSVWDDAYYTSPALQTAFDHFWKNSTAPDGAGLQDHLTAAWTMLAERYRAEPAVIGYDLMNEPMPGAASPNILMALLSRGAELLAGMDGEGTSSIPELAAQFLNPENRIMLFKKLKDASLFSQVIAAPYALCATFEKDWLMPFYKRTAQAIRRIDAARILFLETSGFSNFGVYSAIEPLENGQRDPQQAYAPHAYDLVTDTETVAYPSVERVQLIFARHAETARKWGWPMLVGEWGAYGFKPDTLPAAQLTIQQIEQQRCSETYWTYEPGIEQAACFPAVHRPYPERVAGILDHYHYEPKTGIFECTWTEDPAITAPTVIYLPDWLEYDPQKSELNPTGYRPSEINEQSAGCWIQIMPTGKNVQRTFKVKGRKK
jgi:endoglycosylceramidase